MSCFFSQNGVDPFLMIVQPERLLTTFLLGFPSFLYPRSQVSSLDASPEITSCPHHPFLSCGHLILIGHPLSFTPSFYHEHTILSCPRPRSYICQSFLGDPSLRLADLVSFLPSSCLPPFQASLDANSCLSLAHASLNTSFLPKAHNLFFSLQGLGSSLLYF